MDKEQKERKPLKASLTKLDVAGRQINTAIELLFRGGDAISIHTLAMAAFRILYDVSKRKNRTFHFLFDDMIQPGKEKEFWGKYFNKWSNFAKHAEKDPDGLIEALDESLNDTLLVMCCFGWRDHGRELSHAMNVFSSWFVTVNPNMLKDAALKAKIIEEAPVKGVSRAGLLEVGRRLLEATPRLRAEQSNGHPTPKVG